MPWTRPSSKVNMNERNAAMGLSHMELKYSNRMKKSENGPDAGTGMRKIVLLPYKIGCGAGPEGPLLVSSITSTCTKNILTPTMA